MDGRGNNQGKGIGGTAEGPIGGTGQKGKEHSMEIGGHEGSQSEGTESIFRYQQGLEGKGIDGQLVGQEGKDHLDEEEER